MLMCRVMIRKDPTQQSIYPITQSYPLRDLKIIAMHGGVHFRDGQRGRLEEIAHVRPTDDAHLADLVRMRTGVNLAEDLTRNENDVD